MDDHGNLLFVLARPLLLIGRESGARFLSQSQSVAMQNQSNCVIVFDTQLKTALYNPSITYQLFVLLVTAPISCKISKNTINITQQVLLYLFANKTPCAHLFRASEERATVLIGLGCFQKRPSKIAVKEHCNYPTG